MKQPITIKPPGSRYTAALLLLSFGCGDNTRGADATVQGGSPATGGAGAEATSTAGRGNDAAAGGVAATGGAGVEATSTAGRGNDAAAGGVAATGGAMPAAGTDGGDTGGSQAGGSGGLATGGASAGGSPAAGSGGRSFELPPANGSFDYQIGEPYSPPAGVTVVSRDRNSSPATGLYNICYVNGFQTQPGEESFWVDSHPDLLLRATDGDPVEDEDWGEYLVDTSTEEKRADLAAIVGGWIEQCARDGFDAVEIDNLDSYSRSNGLLTEDDNVAFMALLSGRAHDAGLAVAQKNSTELLGRVSGMGTDFAVAEECNRWDECGDYQAIYGNLVYVIEYREQDFTAGCAAFPELAIVLRDIEVTAPGSASYVYQGC